MSAEEIREHALSLPGAWPDEPWEGDLVAKVGPEDWDDMTVDKRRAYVEEEITAIVVRPAAQRSNRFDYKRLSIVWRTDEPPAD